MSEQSTRRFLVGAGWIGLIVAFLPYYRSFELPKAASEPTNAKIIKIEGEETTNSSRQTSLTIGLPFSPWFSYKTTQVTEMIPGPMPAGNLTIKTADHPENQVTIANYAMTSRFQYWWNVSLFSWSAGLAIGSIILLVLARRHRLRAVPTS